MTTDFNKIPAQLKFQEKTINIIDIEHNEYIYYASPVTGCSLSLKYIMIKDNVRIYIEVMFLKKIIKNMINEIIYTQKEKIIKLRYSDKTIDVVQLFHFSYDTQAKIIYLDCPMTNKLTGFVFIGEEDNVRIFTSDQEVYDKANLKENLNENKM